MGVRGPDEPAGSANARLRSRVYGTNFWKGRFGSMKTSKSPDTVRAITSIVARYDGLIAKAAANGTRIHILTPGPERPDLFVRGDARGRAVMAICTDEGDRHVVFSRWPDGDSVYPENWPEAVQIPNYDRDPMP